MTTTTYTCSFEGCPDPVQAKSLCMGHYMQQRAGRPLTVKRKYLSPDGWVQCLIDGCDRPQKSRGLCTNHAVTRRRFNMTTEEIVALFTDAVCQGCGGVEELQVDHNHDCCPSAIATCGDCRRGILCRRCNTTLGWAEDRLDRLKGLVAYLEAPRMETGA